jgi:hypothetical protein
MAINYGNGIIKKRGKINKVRDIPNARPRTLAQFPAWGIRRSLSNALTEGKNNVFGLKTKNLSDFFLDKM